MSTLRGVALTHDVCLARHMPAFREQSYLDQSTVQSLCLGVGYVDRLGGGARAVVAPTSLESIT